MRSLVATLSATRGRITTPSPLSSVVIIPRVGQYQLVRNLSNDYGTNPTVRQCIDDRTWSGGPCKMVWHMI
jgi:hypothetical protein